MSNRPARILSWIKNLPPFREAKDDKHGMPVGEVAPSPEVPQVPAAVQKAAGEPVSPDKPSRIRSGTLSTETTPLGVITRYQEDTGGKDAKDGGTHGIPSNTRTQDSAHASFSDFMGKVLYLLQTMGKFLASVWYRINRDQVAIMASGMVYSSLMAVVPLVTVILMFLAPMGAIQPFITFLNDLTVEFFGPEAGAQLLGLLTTFTGNATSLGIFGIISFLFTSILLVNKVWTIINQIYHVALNRNPIRRFTNSISFLIIGILLLGLYISIQPIMTPIIASMNGGSVAGFQFFSKDFLQWVIMFVIFFLVIFTVPNTKVRLSSAALGAGIGAVLFSLTKDGMTWMMGTAVTYSVIYGSIASIFFFLLWMYLMWVIILSAVEISYVHQFHPDGKRVGLTNSPSVQIAEALDVLMLIGSNYREGKGSSSSRELGDLLIIPDRRLFSYIELLTSLHYIVATNNNRTMFMPARPLDSMKVREVVEAVYGLAAGEKKRLRESGKTEESDTAGEAISRELLQGGVSRLGNYTIDNLLDRL
ncbi:YihY/virulence factor BrkB family protein [Parasphaerochaeta coccoides]|uniref:Ribonuclease BN n=1 Tax=Parasphaerochaeta coccoides (strain ATCC BAA-1237 / DSM 17374 / SPN1) TaxID=760011 RepID=F4GLP0_PARC1|nr:YhjD/YihY/BrkB family envelope integrity protein [Parasphaerochaeta coccoides]AEC02434.1 ribonuclease BN [Parasphaerochaeta coccoides DSM 17374]